MANKIKETVDYFPFFVGDGRTLYILKRKYGLAGIGFFTELFRFLARTPGHYYCLQNDFDKERFYTFIGIDEDICLEMIECLVETKKIDAELWNKKHVIVSADFLESLTEAYRRRSGEHPTLEYIKEQCNSVPDIEIDDTAVNMPSICRNDDANMTHKEKKIKEDKRKEEQTDKPLPPAVRKKTKTVTLPEEDKELYHNIEKYYLSMQESKNFTNWEKESVAIKGLIAKGKLHAPGNHVEFLKMLTAVFKELRNIDEFYGKHPFLPSSLNSSGIFDRVLNEAQMKWKEKQEAESFDIKGLYNK